MNNIKVNVGDVFVAGKQYRVVDSIQLTENGDEIIRTMDQDGNHEATMTKTLLLHGFTYRNRKMMRDYETMKRLDFIDSHRQIAQHLDSIKSWLFISFVTSIVWFLLLIITIHD